MKREDIYTALCALADAEYREFQARLMPGVDKSRILGVRTPDLRAFARTIASEPDTETFLSSLPHETYDEMNLHGFVISRVRDYDRAVAYVDAYLPYVDNWATCDLLSPTIFAKNKTRLRADIRRWTASKDVFTRRFGLEMLMAHFLDGDFDASVLDEAAAVPGDEYYVMMMRAWFFATALAKQWDATVPYIEKHVPDDTTHRKAIQKATESYRITPEQKAYLKTLKG